MPASVDAMMGTCKSAIDVSTSLIRVGVLLPAPDIRDQPRLMVGESQVPRLAMSAATAGR